MKENYLILGILAVVAFLFVSGNLNLGALTGPGAVGGSAGVVGGAQTGTCGLSVAQTVSDVAYTYGKPTTEVGSANYIYMADRKSINPGNTTTSYGTKYTAYFTRSGYSAAVADFTTPCDNPSPVIAPLMKQYDTSLTTNSKILNSDGLSVNGFFANTANQSISAGSSATVYVRLQPSAEYKHIGGQNSKVCFFFNATNSTQWDATGFSLYTPTGERCADYTGATPTNVPGYIIKGWECSFDFPSSGGGFYQFPLTIKMGTGKATAVDVSGVYVIGGDWYQNTISGQLEWGCVKDDGSAIQTAQHETIQFE